MCDVFVSGVVFDFEIVVVFFLDVIWMKSFVSSFLVLVFDPVCFLLTVLVFVLVCFFMSYLNLCTVVSFLVFTLFWCLFCF